MSNPKDESKRLLSGLIVITLLGILISISSFSVGVSMNLVDHTHCPEN